jgi:ketosteroid isomerase-like protein
MNNAPSIIEIFYKAFAAKDYKTMQQCYHSDAVFSDEAFVNLDAAHVKAMWQMLLTNSKDLALTYNNITYDGNKATANWIAYYTFTLTNRKVINKIHAEFELKDGLIYRHNDSFDFYKWCSMAFGTKGKLLGWLPFFKKKVRQTANERLAVFMKKNRD